jgi:Flp pilus assembly protein TadG
MHFFAQTLPRPSRRPGYALALFVLVAPVLVAMIGLIVDGGLLMAAERQAQNAADSAAIAAAQDLHNGQTPNTALQTAQSFLNDMGFSNVTLSLNAGSASTLNNPPSSGPYAGNGNYAEVIVSIPITTLFIQVLGVNSSQQATARAVAGFDLVNGNPGPVFLVE